MGDILKCFPFGVFRPKQREIIEYIYDAFENKGKKFAILEAPTGFGKSAVALCLALHYNDTHFLTIQKFLQSQYMRDFSDHLVEVKGRANYFCALEGIEEGTSCQEAPCMGVPQRCFSACRGSASKDSTATTTEELEKENETIKCPYFKMIHKAQFSPNVLFNFSSFLYQTKFAKRFEPRTLMIIDECHNIESELAKFYEMTIKEDDLRLLGLAIKDFSEEGSDVWADIFIKAEVLDKIEEIFKRLEKEAKEASELEAIELVREAEKWRGLYFKINRFLENPIGFVVEIAKKQVKGQEIQFLLLRLFDASIYAEDALFQYADHVILMSATVLNFNIFTKSLRIPKNDRVNIRVSNLFPVEFLLMGC